MSNKRNPALSKQRKVKFELKRKLRKAWRKVFAHVSKLEFGFEIWSQSVVQLNVPQTQFGPVETKIQNNWIKANAKGEPVPKTRNT